jgi:hypothetical protein
MFDAMDTLAQVSAGMIGGTISEPVKTGGSLGCSRDSKLGPGKIVSGNLADEENHLFHSITGGSVNSYSISSSNSDPYKSFFKKRYLDGSELFPERQKTKSIPSADDNVERSNNTSNNNNESYSNSNSNSGVNNNAIAPIINKSIALILAESAAVSSKVQGGHDSPVAAKLCKFQGCSEPSSKRSCYCPDHIGTRRCQFQGCTKCAQGGTLFCISHGGGRRCSHEGCCKAARDKLYCVSHGGGRRCQFDNCTRSAIGKSTLCTAHGGGKKCRADGCSKSAQSPTPFCVRHGGGRKCIVSGCSKVSRGKTSYCAGHGGIVDMQTKQRQLVGTVSAEVISSKTQDLAGFVRDNSQFCLPTMLPMNIGDDDTTTMYIHNVADTVMVVSNNLTATNDYDKIPISISNSNLDIPA